MKIRIGLADEQRIFTEGLKRLIKSIESDISCEVAWEVQNGEELLEKLAEEPVNLLFLELCLPKKDGLDLISDIKEDFEELRLCILSQYHDSKFVKQAFQNGADGYILKQNTVEEFSNAIPKIMNGVAYMGDNVSIGPQNNLSNGSPKRELFQKEDSFLVKHSLTKRESEILAQIALAKNNKDIAKDLYISDQTVSVHRKNIMRKLNVSSTAGLIKVAMKHGLVS
jgi:DNA-binding NarL/FixJ family response regulator